MIVETWYKIWCSKCRFINWINGGDMSDCTKSDSEGFICYKCKTPHSFSDDIMKEMGIGNDPECFDVGLDKPEF